MADFSFTITIDDNDVAAAIAAMAWNYSDNGDGINPDTEAPFTNGELRDIIANGTRQAIIDITTRHQRHLASEAAITPITVTA